MTVRKIIKSLSLTLFVFGLLGWIYMVLVAFIQPSQLGWQLTHFWKYPHNDTFGEISFAVSLISFFVYNVVKDEPRNSKHSK